MSNQLKMVTERLVDVFENVLRISREMTCEKKNGVYLWCGKVQYDEGIKPDDMNPKRMCDTCKALWHFQGAKTAWVAAVRRKNPGWDPLNSIPDEQRVLEENAIPKMGEVVSTND